MENTQQTRMLWVWAHVWIISSHGDESHFLWFCSFAGCRRRNKCRFYCKGENKIPACKDLTAQDRRFDLSDEQTYILLFPSVWGDQPRKSVPVIWRRWSQPCRCFFTPLHHTCTTSPPRLTFYRLLFFKTPWVDWGRDHFSSLLLELIPTVMPCLNNANTWWSQHQQREIIWFKHANLHSFSLSLSEHEWCGQAKAAEHSYLLLHYGWEWRNDPRTGRHGHSSADHGGICELSWQEQIEWKILKPNFKASFHIF